MIFAKKLILETNVGVAPGVAFGASGEGYLRICFAAKDSFIIDPYRTGPLSNGSL